MNNHVAVQTLLVTRFGSCVEHSAEAVMNLLYLFNRLITDTCESIYDDQQTILFYYISCLPLWDSSTQYHHHFLPHGTHVTVQSEATIIV